MFSSGQEGSVVCPVLLWEAQDLGIPASRAMSLSSGHSVFQGFCPSPSSLLCPLLCWISNYKNHFREGSNRPSLHGPQAWLHILWWAFQKDHIDQQSSTHCPLKNHFCVRSSYHSEGAKADGFRCFDGAWNPGAKFCAVSAPVSQGSSAGPPWQSKAERGPRRWVQSVCSENPNL